MMEVQVKIQGGYVLTLVDYDSKVRIEGKSGSMEMDLMELQRAISLLARVAQGSPCDGN